MATSVRVLFVDDEESMLRAITRLVADAGYEITTTTDAFAVARLVVDKRIDIVVSDNMMPGMTGMDLFIELHRSHPRVTRIMMTASADKHTAMRAINEGHVDYLLEKPFTQEQLKRVLEDAVAAIAAWRAAAPPDLAAAARSFGRTSTQPNAEATLGSDGAKRGGV